MTLDMTKTTEPKSDQMNYDDFIGGGTKTIMIADVRSTGSSEAQPISIHYEGDEGKPYKPCKSMRRVMVHAWGGDGLKYIGKSLTLFGDPEVKWAGKNVGGIRISHMSHIENEMNISLTSSQGKRKLHQVKPLKVDMGNIDEEVEKPIYADDLIVDAKEFCKKGKQEFTDFFNSQGTQGREILKTIMPELEKICAKADKEIPADPPPSQDEEAGTVEPDVTAPQTTGSTTHIPIEDKSKWLSRNEIIKSLGDCKTDEEVNNLIAVQSLGIADKCEKDRITISNAAIDRKKELSDA